MAACIIPGMCIVVMVVVVIKVVVVSSSMGSEDMVFLDPVWLAAEEELRAVVSSPGDMTVAVDSVCPSPGTACVGLVVVPAEMPKGSSSTCVMASEQSAMLHCR